MKQNKKLKYVHIGNDVWSCGAINQSYQNVRGRLHMKIYGPNNKQYDVYDSDVKYITTELDEDGYIKDGTINRSGNYAIQEKLKIYILTSILDKRENWTFDLNIIPQADKLKIIYDNGTVKNIDFNGVFEPVTITKNYINGGIKEPYNTKIIKPIAYRVF